jgi:hypothetical protein
MKLLERQPEVRSCKARVTQGLVILITAHLGRTRKLLFSRVHHKRNQLVLLNKKLLPFVYFLKKQIKCSSHHKFKLSLRNQDQAKINKIHFSRVWGPEEKERRRMTKRNEGTDRGAEMAGS